MKKLTNSIVLFVFLQIFFFLLPTLFFTPIIVDNGLIPVQKEKQFRLSQGVDLEIYVPDYQMSGVENVKDDFLASPLGFGVDSVTVISSGSTSDQQLSNLKNLVQGGSATTTVIGLDLRYMAIFAENGWIIELDQYLQPNELDDYSPGMVTACKYKSKTYAYPYLMNLGVLYYRKDLLDDFYGAGMWSEADFDTWEELNQTANLILNNVSTPSKYPDLVGYVGQFDTYEGGANNFFEWCGSNGAIDLINSTGEVNINTQNVKKAMQFIQALVPPQYTGVQGTDYIIPRSGLVFDEASSGNVWLANNSIFCRQWPYIYSLSVVNNLEFGIAPLPHFEGATGYKTSAVGGTILAVPSSTTGIARQAAVNFTKFLGDTLAQESGLIATGTFPVLKSVYSNPPTGYEWINNWSSQVDLTLTIPITLKYHEIFSTVTNYFSDLLSGQKSVDVALAGMQEDVEEIIAGLKPGIFTLTSDADSPDNDGTFNITWTNSDGADSYSIYSYSNYITEINSSLTMRANLTALSPFLISGLTNGNYYFVVVAYNGTWETLSNNIQVEVRIPPRQFYLSSDADKPIDTDGSFNLTWSNSEGADNYSIYSFSGLITKINGSLNIRANQTASSPFPITNLLDGHYFFVVVAYNKTGETLSNNVNITVKHLGPGSFTLSSDSNFPDTDGSFNLTWTVSEGADNYSIYSFSGLITKINGSLNIIENQTAISPFLITDLVNGNYYFIIVAYNNFGYNFSNCININVQIYDENDGVWKLNPLIIDNEGNGDYTWSQVAALPWCVGLGTSDNPYIIEFLEIDGQNSDSCLTIRNSSIFFIIRNSTFYNSGKDQYDAGIKLTSTLNGEIIANNCSFNNGNGILLESCLYIKIQNNTVNNNILSGIVLIDCKNIDIIDNTNSINSNEEYGVRLLRSDNNNILRNTINNNSIGIYIVDSNNNFIDWNTLLDNGVVIVDIGEGTNSIGSNNLIPEVSKGIDYFTSFLITLVVLIVMLIIFGAITAMLFIKIRSSKPTMKEKGIQYKELKKRVISVPEHEKHELKRRVFLSYSTLDSQYFQISEVSKALESYPEISKILYWEADSGENIVEYMEKTLKESNVFVLFCSKNSSKSKAVNDEWQAAFQLRKKGLIKIIPVYEKEKYVPVLLTPLLNVKFSKDNLIDFIINLYKEILRD